MKQTNGALTFLLKAYRSLFKSAYLKGLASAVILTAGLGAGATQALAVPFADNATEGATTNVVVSGTVTINSKEEFAHDVTVGPMSSLTSAENSAGHLRVSGDFVVNGGTLTLQGTATNQYGIVGAFDDTLPPTGSFSLNSGTISLNNSQITMDTISLNGGSISVNGENAQATLAAVTTEINGTNIVNNANLTFSRVLADDTFSVHVTSGSITNNQDRVINFDHTDLITEGGTITNNGTLNFSSSDVVYDDYSGEVVNTGSVIGEGTTFINNGTVAVNEGNLTLAYNKADFSNLDFIQQGAALTNYLTGTYQIASGANLTLEGAYTLGDAKIENKGNLTVGFDSFFVINNIEQLKALGSVELIDTSGLDEGSLYVSSQEAQVIDSSLFGEGKLHGNEQFSNGGSIEGNTFHIKADENKQFNSELIEVGADNFKFLDDGTTLIGKEWSNGDGTMSRQETELLVRGTLEFDKTLNLTDWGSLYLENWGQNNGQGTITGDTIEIEGIGQFYARAGTWVGANTTILVNNDTQAVITGRPQGGSGNFNLGDPGSHDDVSENLPNLTLKKFDVQRGVVNLNWGTLTADSLTIAAYGQDDTYLADGRESMVRIGSEYGPATLLVTGNNSGSVSLAQSSVTIDDNGTFELGSIFADKIELDASKAVENGIANDAFILNGGTLKLDFTSGELDGTKLNALKDALIKDYTQGSTLNGFINVGNASLTGIEVTNGKISWDDIQAGGAAGIVTDVTNNALTNATVTGVDADDVLYGSYGTVELTDGVTSLNVQNQLVLNGASANGNYVQDATGKAASIVANGKVNLNLAGNGAVKDITLSSDEATLITSGTLTANSVLVSGSVTMGGNATVNTVVTGELTTTGALNFESVTTDTLDASGTINVSNADGTGSLTVNNSSSFERAEVNADNLNLSANTYHSFDRTSVNADTVTVGDGGELHFVSGSNAEVTNFNLDSGANVYVGSDLSSEFGSTSSYLTVGNLNLNGGNLIIDPGYDVETAIVATDKLDQEVINGTIVIGKNSAFGVSFASAEALDAQLVEDGLKNGIALKEENGAVAYFNTPVTLATGASIYLDPTQDNIDASMATADITLKEGSAIVISDTAAAQALADNKAVVTLTGNTTSTVTADGGKVLLSGAFNTMSTGFKVFGTGTGARLILSNDIAVESVNGVLSGTILENPAVGTEIGTLGQLTINEERLNAYTSNASGPVKGLLQDALLGNLGSQGAGVAFLTSVGTGTAGASAADVDTAARLATFGGALQATYTAMQTSVDAVNSRMGMGVTQGNMVVSETSQGAGIWFVPVYRNHDSDSFDADGVDYGVDMDLYGAALGVDYTTANDLRFGAYFNIGSGDADGQGAASNVSNDFDYWGVGLYGGMSFNQFTLTADLGYTQVSNDIDGDTALGSGNADPDSAAFTVGLTAQYTFETSMLDVTPHVGLRYTSLELDDYDVDSSYGVIASTDADRANVFSIPVGVTLSSDLDAGAWTVKPALDLQVTANTGDTEFDTDTTFSGANRAASLSAEILDDWTYGATLGIEAQYNRALSLGVNVSYVGSDNADELGVTGNVRYAFQLFWEKLAQSDFLALRKVGLFVRREARA